jgi:hypothetical protein
MFPTKIKRRNKTYYIINNFLTESELKELFQKNPYDVYAIVNESLEKDEPMLTTFLVLYSIEFEDNVILYDISRQHHTTVTTELSTIAKGYVEFIDVGIVDRYSIKFYIQDE